MRFTGYQSVDEIADILGVSASWLELELSEQLPDLQLTLYGENNYLETDLRRWFDDRHAAVINEQRRMREIAREIEPKPRLTMLDPSDAV